MGLGGWGSRTNEAGGSVPFGIACNFDATMGAALNLAKPLSLNGFQNYKSSGVWGICFLEVCCENLNRWKWLKWRYLQAIYSGAGAFWSSTHPPDSAS